MVKRLLALRNKPFVRDTLVMQLASLTQAGTYFITSVLTARYLSKDDLGRWVTSREIFMFAYFLVSMGLVNATVSRYSEAVGRQDRQSCVDALAAMLKIGALSSALVIVLGFVFAPMAGEYFYADRQVGQFAAVLCIAGVFEVVRGLTVAVLQGTRQMRPYAWFDISTCLLRVVLVWAVLALDWGLPGIVGAFVGHMLVSSVIAIRFYRAARREHAKLAPPPLREVLAAVPRAPVRHLFGLGYMIALNKAVATLVPRLGMLLIPAHDPGRSFDDNAAYSIGQVLSYALAMAMTGVTQTLLPTLGLKMGSSDVPFERMGGLLRRVSLLAGGIMTLLTLLSIPVMWLVIRLFYGSAYEDAFPYYLWLSTGNLFLGFLVVAEPFYIYSGKIRLAVPINFAAAALATVMIVLGREFYGPIGVAAAAGLCRGLGCVHLVYMWVYFHRARTRSDGSNHTPGVSP